MSHPLSPPPVTPPPLSPSPTGFMTISSIPSPLRSKKSKVELPSPPASKLLSIPTDYHPLPNNDHLDVIDQQLSVATSQMSINFMDRDIISLFTELSSSPPPSRLPLVRSIKNKLIGSSLTKQVCLSEHLHLTLLSLLRELCEEDQAESAELRLELMTALASLAANYREGAEALLEGEFLGLVVLAVRGGHKGMQEGGIRALKHLITSCSHEKRYQVGRQIMQHVEVVSILVQSVRQWHSPSSDLAAEVLSHACYSLAAQLCLIQHGLLSAVMNHLSMPSKGVRISFVSSLRILSALCYHNPYLAVFFSSPPSSSSTPFSALCLPASALYSFCSALLLHADPQVKLYSSSILLSSALVHLALRRAAEGGLKEKWVREEEERLKRNTLLRLHRDHHASPIGKRGRGGSEKGKKSQGEGEKATFPLVQWISSLHPSLISALSMSTSASLELLSSLLPRVLSALTRLVESSDMEIIASACCMLAEAVEGNETFQEEVAQALPALLFHLHSLASAPPALSSSPSLLLPVLRLLLGLSSHETPRLVLLTHSAFGPFLNWALTQSSLAVSLSLRILCRLSDSHRFHLSSIATSPSLRFLIVECALRSDYLSQSSAMQTLAALLAPHTAMRSSLLRDFSPSLIDTLFSHAKGTGQAAMMSEAKEEEEVGVDLFPSWQPPTLRCAALGVLAAWCAHSHTTVQQAILKGLGGWKELLGMLTGKEDDGKEVIVCGVLELIKQLLRSGAQPADSRLPDWTETVKREEKKEASTVVLTLSDISLLLSALTPLFSTPSSSPLFHPLLHVALSLTIHPSWTSSLFFSSPHFLSFFLLCLQSPLSTSRELACCELFSALFSLLNEREEGLDDLFQEAASSQTTNGGKKRRRSSQTEQRRGKRRSLSSGAEEQKGEEVENELSASLLRLSASGIIAHLLHIRKSEVDEAVAEHVKRILLLLHLMATLVNAASPAPSPSSALMEELCALDVEEEGGEAMDDVDLPSSRDESKEEEEEEEEEEEDDEDSSDEAEEKDSFVFPHSLPTGPDPPSSPTPPPPPRRPSTDPLDPLASLASRFDSLLFQLRHASSSPFQSLRRGQAGQGMGGGRNGAGQAGLMDRRARQLRRVAEVMGVLNRRQEEQDREDEDSSMSQDY